jgi:hypothetical protein
MERSKQIQFGLLGVLALLLAANLATGGFKKMFQSEGDQIRNNAAIAATPTGAQGQAESGNIPNTNVNSPAVPSGPSTTIKYDNERFDYGIIDEGEIVKHAFKFTNTGKEPLVISNCKGSCGCTVPTWPKEPIAPGATAEIKVEFNSKGKPGPQSKRVTVTANTNPTETFLEVAGEVKGKAQPDAKGN